MALEWARSLRDQCEEADVAFWFKQSGGPRPETGRELDGRRWEQLPTDCLHPDADGTGNPDEWECQACGLIWHEVEDPAGPISGGNGLHWRREVVRPAWRPGIRRILA
jgi:rubredoxin